MKTRRAGCRATTHPERRPARLGRWDGVRAAVIAAVTSLVIVRTCLHYVAEAADLVTAAVGGATASAGYVPEEAAEAVEAGLATLAVIVPLLLLLPFAGWNVAREAGAGVPLARGVCLVAVAVWALSVWLIRFGARPLLLAAH